MKRCLSIILALVMFAAVSPAFAEENMENFTCAEEDISTAPEIDEEQTNFEKGEIEEEDTVTEAEAETEIRTEKSSEVQDESNFDVEIETVVETETVNEESTLEPDDEKSTECATESGTETLNENKKEYYYINDNKYLCYDNKVVTDEYEFECFYESYGKIFARCFDEFGECFDYIVGLSDEIEYDKSQEEDELTLFAVTSNSNETTVYKYLVNTMGLNTAGACGVLANIEKESGFKPTALGDSGTSYGICQWHESRYTRLKTWCSNNGYDYTTITGQLHYLEYELKTYYSSVDSYIKSVANSAQGAYDSAYHWCYNFEKPSNRDSVSDTRGNYAKNTYWPEYKDQDQSSEQVSLHAWVSKSAMGEGASGAIRLGDAIYLCYELLDSSGSQIDGYSYTVNESFYDPSGSLIASQNYTNNNNWYSIQLGSGADTGTYKGVVTVTGDISLTVTLSWSIYDTVPSITSNPTAQTVSSGSSVTFSVAASGTHLSYQWYYATSAGGTGTAISGATSSSYKISSATTSMSGRYYYCAVSNYGNSTVYSSRALLTVKATQLSLHAWISKSAMGDEASDTIRLGDAIYLCYELLDSSGSLIDGYSYTVNESFYDPSGSLVASHDYTNNNNWYAIQTGSGADTGIYKGVITITGDISATMTLNVNVRDTVPSITSNPTAKTVSSGSSATFSVAASGTHLSYQWYYASSSTGTGTAISGATSSSYTISSAKASMSGRYYYCEISNYGNTNVYSSRALLTVKSTITYNANSGSGAPSSQTVTGTSATISTTVPTRTGYTFLGWSTSNSATSATYTPGSTITVSGSITLYAVWKAETYAVVYDANGGSGAPSDQQKTYNVAITLRTAKPTREGYTFISWNTAADGSGKSYDPGDSYTENAEVTLYAQWMTAYTVIYDANGGSGAPPTQTISGTTVTLSSIEPVRAGYQFLGWSTSKTATSATHAAGSTITIIMISDDITLYAVWKIETVGVSGISLDNSSITLTAGSEKTLTATVLPSDATNTNVDWKSSDVSVATVSSKGIVSAKSAGTATITATTTDGGYAATCKVTVLSSGTAPKLTVGSVQAAAGQTVSVNVKLENNPGIVSMTLSLDYDDSVFTLVDVTDGGILGSTVHGNNLEATPYILCWANDTVTENYMQDGTIVTLKFNISEDAKQGTYPINISYDNDNDEILNVDLETVDFAVENGEVIITDVVAGDVNGDGKITSTDRVFLARYLAKWDGYTEENVDLNAADVNGDGKVTATDRVILSRYLAKWQGYEMLPYNN